MTETTEDLGGCRPGGARNGLPISHEVRGRQTDPLLLRGMVLNLLVKCRAVELQLVTQRLDRLRTAFRPSQKTKTLEVPEIAPGCDWRNGGVRTNPFNANRTLLSQEPQKLVRPFSGDAVLPQFAKFMGATIETLHTLVHKNNLLIRVIRQDSYSHDLL